MTVHEASAQSVAAKSNLRWISLPGLTVSASLREAEGPRSLFPSGRSERHRAVAEDRL